MLVYLFRSAYKIYEKLTNVFFILLKAARKINEAKRKRK
jgi:hypothetical protein